jgi:WhiB family redox-sensing transcriptional regulator
MPKAPTYTRNLSARGEDWRHQAKCRGLSDDAIERLFFPTQTVGNRAGKRFCLGSDDGHPCPVIAQCRAFAIANRIEDGIWGATTEKDRRDLRRAEGPRYGCGHAKVPNNTITEADGKKRCKACRIAQKRIAA